MPPEAREAYLAVIAHLLVADFHVTDEEHSFLSDVATRLQIDRETLSRVLGTVDIGGDVAPLLAQVPASQHGRLIEDLELAAVIDGEVAAREQAIIDHVTQLIATSQARTDADRSQG